MSKQEQALVKLYKGMSTEEIQARVAGGDLMALAMGVAENELQQRLSGRQAGAATVAPGYVNWTTVTILVVVAVALLAGCAMMMPKPLQFFVPLAIFAVMAAITKAFPLFGKIVGGLFMLSPLAIFGWLFYDQSVSRWGSGETLLMYFMAFIYSCIALVIGSAVHWTASQLRK